MDVCMSSVETTIEVEKPEDRLFNKSFDIVKESMKDVIQEMVITLEDSSAHIVYIQSINFDNSKLTVEFSTLSEDRKEELGPHVENCIKIQINEIMNSSKKRKNLFSFV